MALVLKQLYKGYFWTFHELRDPRSDDYWLMSSPLAPVSIVLAYLYVIFVLGPKLMTNRKPYNVTNLMRLYNTVQIIANTYITYYAIPIMFGLTKSCTGVDYTDNSPFAKLQIHIGYIYFILKISDLLDTVFFVLRKSYRQVSFLHVYHHSGMVIGTWLGVKYLAGGESAYIVAVNGFIHCVMYTYYLLATFDDSWKSAKCKKHITQLQLAQFFLFIVIFGRMLFIPECFYPKILIFVFVTQNVLMVYLFGDFYLKAYVYNKKG